MRAEVESLLARHRAGGGWAPLARAITLVENTPPRDLEILVGESAVHVVSITGPPGAGKSTLAGRLIEAYGDAGARVAVLAVDPSSPLTGGAVLGDRVRMETQLAGRPDVFVRSLASRGGLGALAAATRNVARLLEASGSFEVVVIETVGAGQTEVAIAGLADTVLLVTVPGLGDAVQAIKAGLMEVADHVVVNMADRPGAAETVRHLRLMSDRNLPIHRTVATDGSGVDELHAALVARWEQLCHDGALAAGRQHKQHSEAVLVAQEWVRATSQERSPARDDGLREAVGRILEEAQRQWQA